MVKFLNIFFLVICVQAKGWALNRLLSANASGEQDVLRLELLFDQAVDANKLTPQFSDRTMSLAIPDVAYKKKSTEMIPSVSFVNNIKIEVGADKALSIQFLFTDIQAAQMKENLTMEAAGNSLIIEILPPIWSKPSLVESTPIESKQIVTQEAKAKTDDKLANEKEIPLFEKKHDRSSESSGMSKILFMVLGVSLLGGYLLWWLKNKSKMVNGPESLMKIKVLTQFHLGPKKSLVVVRVAGESLLLGISENQINLIKTLALLDEDLPEVTTDSFGEALDEQIQPTPKAKKVQEVETDNFSDEEFSFGPAVKTTLSKKIPLLRRII